MRNGSSVFILPLLGIVSIALLVCVFSSDRFGEVISFNAFKSVLYNNPLQNQLLQTKIVTTSDPIRLIQLEGSTTGHRSKNPTHTTRQITKQRRQKQGLEEELARARNAIRKATSVHNLSFPTINGDDDPNIVIYRNPAAFYQSYKEMERKFKVYVYEEGDLPITHDGPCKDIYTIEGRFIQQIEHENGGGKFRTKDAHHAHVYFMPFSVTRMVDYLYKPLTYNLNPLTQFVSDYVRVVSTKYPFWNRTQGADHFMLACHDWGPMASQGNQLLYNTSIRVLCNANTSEGFDPQKDVTLPEVNLINGVTSLKLLSLASSSSTPRPYLAFFAGGVHGQIRAFLMEHWKDCDSDLRVYEYLPKDLDYYAFMMSSKFCLCPSGYEVASPRVVEALYAECIPVIISQNYVLPFSDVLNWEEFSISVEVSEIPRLKEILMGVSEEKYKKLKEGVKAVRKHFVLNQPAQRFDVFHMILHSIWLRRINLQL